MVAAWTGSMRDNLIRNIAEAFLCPELWTAAEYAHQIESAGMRVVCAEELASEVARTWDLAAERIRKSRWLLLILPGQYREFVGGVELMREAYRTGQLTYSVVVAKKP